MLNFEFYIPNYEEIVFIGGICRKCDVCAAGAGARGLDNSL